MNIDWVVDRIERWCTDWDQRTVWSKMSFSNEAKATTRISSELIQWWSLILYKIPDWKGRWENPYDLYWIIKGGRHISIEVKDIKSKTISYKAVLNACELHQIVNLELEARLWWIALLLAYHRHTNSFYFYKYKHNEKINNK